VTGYVEGEGGLVSVKMSSRERREAIGALLGRLDSIRQQYEIREKLAGLLVADSVEADEEAAEIEEAAEKELRREDAEHTNDCRATNCGGCGPEHEDYEVVLIGLQDARARIAGFEAEVARLQALVTEWSVAAAFLTPGDVSPTTLAKFGKDLLVQNVDAQALLAAKGEADLLRGALKTARDEAAAAQRELREVQSAAGTSSVPPSKLMRQLASELELCNEIAKGLHPAGDLPEGASEVRPVAELKKRHDELASMVVILTAQNAALKEPILPTVVGAERVLGAIDDFIRTVAGDSIIQDLRKLDSRNYRLKCVEIGVRDDGGSEPSCQNRYCNHK
jgi:hypothetical protein